MFARTQSNIDLFDEQLKLADRIETFSKTVNKIYSDMGQTLSTHHDERTAATFLTYHNPDNFTFYKSLRKTFSRILRIDILKMSKIDFLKKVFLFFFNNFKRSV